MSTDSHPSEGAAGIRDFLGIVRRQGWIVLACVLITAAVAGYVEHRRQKTTYSASAQLLVRGTDPSTALPGTSVPFSDPTRTRATDLQLITVPAIAQGVARQLHNGLSPGALLGMVSAGASGDSDIISVSARASTRAVAAQVANAFVDVYVRFRRVTDRRQFAEAIHIASVNLARARGNRSRKADVPDLRTQLNRLRLLSSLETADAQVVARADPRTASRSASKWQRIAGAGALLGLVIGILLAGLRERLDDRLRTEDDVEALLPGVPVIASIPSVRAQRRSKRAAVSARFHDLAAVVDVLRPPTTPRALLVTSSEDGDGKSTTSANLALAISEASGRDSVLLIDGDLRRADLTRRLGTTVEPDRPALPQLSRNGEDLGTHVQHASAKPRRRGRGPRIAVGGDVALVPSARPTNESLERFDDASAGGLLDRARAHAPTVIIDGPPLGVAADMLAIARRADGVIVTVRLGHTRAGNLQRLARRLAVAGIEPLGVVVLGGARGDTKY